MSKVGAIGIDFGTTKTMMVYAEPGKGRAIIVDSFPTAIRFVDEKKFSWNGHIIGDEAFNAPQGWKNFKKFMADERVPVDKCCEVFFEEKEAPSPVLLASFIFRRLKLKLDEFLGTDNKDEIGPVTITVPSERNFLHRQAVVFAANIAGFENVNILEEPIGAYLLHYFNNPKISRSRNRTRVLVIDFGGGTCDLVLAESNNRQIPIVINSRTVDQAGNDIDDAIVGLWKKNKDFKKRLPPKTKGQYELKLTLELKQAAKLAKHQCNPRPDATPEAIKNMLRDPLASQRSSDDKNFIKLPNKTLVEPPRVIPSDFDIIMGEFLSEIDAQINYMLPSQSDIESVDKIVFAGGSCYIRQVIDYVKRKFNHITQLDNFLFSDPENAIAFGALEYQRERNEKRNPVHTRLSMSAYLQVDYDSREIPDLVKTINGVRFIYHNGKSYIELASKGEPLKVENPDVSAWIGAAIRSNVMTIPIRKSVERVTWKIFQVRSETPNGHDYEAITQETKAIDEIAFELNQLENALDYRTWLRLIYAFDIYGDFYRNARLAFRRKSHVQTLHGKNPNLDWRNRKRVRKIREEYFQQ